MDTSDPSAHPPVDGNEHAFNSDYDLATIIGGTAKVVYRGTGTSVNVTNLANGTPYFVRIYRYAGSGTGESGINYLEDTPLTGSGTPFAASAPTLSTPVRGGVLSDVTSNTATLGATQLTEGNPANVTAQGIVWNTSGGPRDGDPGTTTIPLVTGSTLANGAFLEPASPLAAGTRIHFAGYAFNGLYGYSVDGTPFWTEPANQPESISITPDANSLTISWSDASGATASEGAIVVVRAGSDPDTDIPVDGNDAISYSPNADWDFAGALGTSKVVFMGSGNSVNVTNLANSTTYYVRIYGYAGSGTGETGINYLEPLPLTGFGTPFASGPGEATNLRIHNIGSTTMSLYWTEGAGDGSIVVMKHGSVVDSHPVDGTDTYTAGSAFQAGTELGTGNYVVYKGTGEFVNVTSLTGPAPQSFHAAVYTFTGSGNEILYQEIPATASALTRTYTPHNVAIANVDPAEGSCTNRCHGKHGNALVPRGTGQEDVCFTCHQAAGFPGIDEYLEYGLHTNDMTDPVSTAGTIVDCGACHELHNPGSWNTTESTHPVVGGDPKPNLHYLRANPKKYVPDALDSELVMHTDTDSDDWAINNGTHQGACQICHKLTAGGYTNDDSGQEATHQGGNSNCRQCHTHGTPHEPGGFAGGGGDCIGCHNKEQDLAVDGDRPRRDVMLEFPGGDPEIQTTHLKPTVDAADCEVCHDWDPTWHQGGEVKLKDPDGGASITLSPYADPVLSTGSADAQLLTNFCKGCHDSDGATRYVGNETSPFTTPGTAKDVVGTNWSTASHNSPGTVGCFGDGSTGCHSSGHGSKKLTLLAPYHVAPTPPDNTEEQEGFCYKCHDGSPASSDIENEFTMVRETTPTNYQVTAEGGGSANQRHDVLWDDQQNSNGYIECNSCHLPHEDTSSNPVTYIPGTSTALGPYVPGNSAYNSGGDRDPLNPLGSTGNPTEPDYIAFCNACHDGTAENGTSMSGLRIIATDYTADQHGKVGSASGSGNGFLKYPWRAYNENCKNGSWDGSTWTNGVWTDCSELTVNYAALQCTTCHGAHGSGNIYNLRTSITVAGVQMTVGGWTGNVGEPEPANVSDDHTVYTLPLSGGVQANYFWGAWCTFCHQIDSHSKTETKACASSHVHGQKF